MNQITLCMYRSTWQWQIHREFSPAHFPCSSVLSLIVSLACCFGFTAHNFTVWFTITPPVNLVSSGSGQLFTCARADHCRGWKVGELWQHLAAKEPYILLRGWWIPTTQLQGSKSWTYIHQMTRNITSNNKKFLLCNF